MKDSQYDFTNHPHRGPNYIRNRIHCRTRGRAMHRRNRYYSLGYNY